MPTNPRIRAAPAMASGTKVSPPGPWSQRLYQRLERGHEPDEVLALPEVLGGEEGHGRPDHGPAVGHERHEPERGHGRGDRRAEGSAAPGGRQRGHDHGQHDDRPRVAGESRQARGQGRGEPVPARQGEQAGRRRRSGRGPRCTPWTGRRPSGRRRGAARCGRRAGSPTTSRTASQIARAALRPKTNAATNAASGRLSRVTSASALTAVGKAGKKAHLLPSPSLTSWCG